jgi:peptidoglycan/xylan/chitin deacetylase (PgdA/CDA1 family)
MRNHYRLQNRTFLFNLYLSFFSIVAILLAAGCGPSKADLSLESTKMFQNALLTATFALKSPTPSITPAPPTATLPPSATPIPPTATADPNRTPPALPPAFQSSYLKQMDSAHPYIKDTCNYLKMRWDPNNSEPGTVVMPIMFHSITDGTVTQNDQISVEFFNQLMHDLKQQGFEAITTDQLVNFLETNAKIPPRSVILIVDDRKRSAYFETHFKPYYESNGWKVVNAWISAPDTPDYLWKENETVEAAGYVDHQAHGVIHNIPMGEDSKEDFIRNEIFGAIDAIQKHFNKKPIAFIWPGGGFSKLPIQIAREAGYKIGFTINPRGPLMFNWIPLSDKSDPGRPSFMPEGGMDDPLMVLPRYWDTDAPYRIDEVRQIGKAATADAAANRAVELEYYDIVCKPVTGEIPGLQSK